jgi:hypothetical protein
MSEMIETQAPPEKKRPRRFHKRRFKRLPPPAIAVRPLWEQASEEEKKRAHLQCTTILQLWLGKITKEQAMAALELPPLRLWQLSQQAVSGMIAGLLKQPRTRLKGMPMGSDPENDPRVLRKRIAQLEKELACERSVNDLLQRLPWSREASTKEDSGRRPKTKSKTPKASSSSPQTSRRELPPELAPGTPA